MKNHLSNFICSFVFARAIVDEAIKEAGELTTLKTKTTPLFLLKTKRPKTYETSENDAAEKGLLAVRAV